MVAKCLVRHIQILSQVYLQDKDNIAHNRVAICTFLECCLCLRFVGNIIVLHQGESPLTLQRQFNVLQRIIGLSMHMVGHVGGQVRAKLWLPTSLLGHCGQGGYTNFICLEVTYVYNFHLNEKKDTSHNIDPICISLTINFCGNLHEYFFVRNQ